MHSYLSVIRACAHTKASTKRKKPPPRMSDYTPMVSAAGDEYIVHHDVLVKCYWDPESKSYYLVTLNVTGTTPTAVPLWLGSLEHIETVNPSDLMDKDSLFFFQEVWTKEPSMVPLITRVAQFSHSLECGRTVPTLFDARPAKPCTCRKA